MSDNKPKSSQNLRSQRNADILRRMRNGDPLNAIDSRASWFPPRPVIKKDQSEMARLYNNSSLTGIERRGASSPMRQVTDDSANKSAGNPVSLTVDGTITEAG